MQFQKGPHAGPNPKVYDVTNTLKSPLPLEWSLLFSGYNSKTESFRETLCTLGNGHFATRGAAEEVSSDSVHYPGTYLAGGYNRLRSKIGGLDLEHEDLVNFPNWLPLTFRIDDGDRDVGDGAYVPQVLGMGTEDFLAGTIAFSGVRC